jgi:hypothetical protein
MKMETLVLFQPRHDIRVFVGAVVVQDDVNLFAPRDLPVDQAQESQELLVAVT